MIALFELDSMIMSRDWSYSIIAIKSLMTITYLNILENGALKLDP